MPYRDDDIRTGQQFECWVRDACEQIAKACDVGNGVDVAKDYIVRAASIGIGMAAKRLDEHIARIK